MSEPIWTIVQVKAPAALTPDMAAVLGELGEYLCEGGIDPEPCPGDDNAMLHTFAGDSNYGINDDLREMLTRLRELGLPYHATADAKYEWLGEWERWDVVHGERTGAYAGESAIITEADVARFRTECAGLPPTAILARIEHALGMDLPDLATTAMVPLDTGATVPITTC